MCEKLSHLLAKAKDLIKDQLFKEALCICEDILKNDENNVNALLMSTKCWMDLNMEPSNVKKALEKVLFLKPNNITATQGLRKFYEKYLVTYLNDAIEFYYCLYTGNELIEKDFELITINMARLKLSTKGEDLLVKCLIRKIEDISNEACLCTFFCIATEKYILYQETELLDKLIKHFDNQIYEDPSEAITKIQNMVTLVKAVIAKKDAETLLSLIREFSIKHTYAYILLGRILCDNYLIADCEDTIAMGIDQLEKDVVYDHDVLLAMLINIRIENQIHFGDLESLEGCWSSLVDTSTVPLYLWCQAHAVGLTGLVETINQLQNDPLCWGDLQLHQRLLGRHLASEEALIDDNVTQIQRTFTDGQLTSFEWFLWADVLRKKDQSDAAINALQCALKLPPVYFGVYLKLADVCSQKNDYNSCVQCLEHALGLHVSMDIVDRLVTLHVHWQKYEAALSLLEVVDVDACSVPLLLRFVDCFSRLDKLTEAICLTQRVVKKCRTDPAPWQLLGDLYLRRDNINLANKAYDRSVQLAGPTADNCARLGNVAGLSYQETMEENEFTKSVALFTRSLDLGWCLEAIQGLTSVLCLHAEVALKQLMLSAAIRDINRVITVITNNADQLKESRFHMSILGKVILLAVMGSVDKMIDVGPVEMCYFREDSINGDCMELASRCFQESIRTNSCLADSHYHIGLLALIRLNKRCGGTGRGETIDSGLYGAVERHLKSALSYDMGSGDSWKYLGYLYLRHGSLGQRTVLDIQHCLSMAVMAGTDKDKINDPEAAFYLGLLYMRENRTDAALEVFKKLQIDYPIDPIASVGMYLLSGQNNAVQAGPEIARSLMTYIYKDEASSAHDSCYQLNSSLIGLFVNKMGHLVHNLVGNDSENVASDNYGIGSSTLVAALRTALSSAWTKYLAYSAIGQKFDESEEKKLKEYGCILGIMELLLGDFNYGKKLILQNTIINKNSQIHNFFELEECWSSERGIELLLSLSKSLGLNLSDDHKSLSSSFTNKQYDEMLISLVIDQLSPANHNHFIDKYFNTLISSIPLLSSDNSQWSVDDQVMILLSLGSCLLSGLGDRGLCSEFVRVVTESFSTLVVTDERLVRVLCRLRLVSMSEDNSVVEVARYMYGLCLRQPLEMNRWLNLLEYGLEYSVQLAGTDLGITKLFLITNRPWCLASLDIERYSHILSRYNEVITLKALKNHRHMFLKTMKMFPESCVSLLKKYSGRN